MMYRTICTKCVHYMADPLPLDAPEGIEQPDAEYASDRPPYCAAFPNGIPDEILRSGFDHRQPFEGDNGIQFTPKGDVDLEWIEKTVGPRPDRDPANW